MSVQAKAVIKGTLFWPFLERTNPMKKGKHTVDLGLLDKDAVKTLNEMGLQDCIKKDDKKKQEKEEKPFRGTYISLKTGYPPEVFDVNRTAVNPDSIGNGTVANVRVTAFDYAAGATWKAGRSGGFNAIQVTELVEFVRSSDMSDFEFEGDDFDPADEGKDIGKAADAGFEDD